MNMLTRTGDRQMVSITHVGCAECGAAVPVTELHYWKRQDNGSMSYFCNARCSLKSHERALGRGRGVRTEFGVLSAA